MDQELATYHNINTSLNLQISELNSKLTAAVKESGSLRESSMGLRVLVSRFRADLQVVAKAIQNPKALVAAVQSIHARYCSEGAQDPTMSLDEELQKEHNSQREYLERSIASLRHKVWGGGVIGANLFYIIVALSHLLTHSFSPSLLLSLPPVGQE